MIYTGAINNATLLSIEDETTVQFIYGKIVYDLSNQFNPDDWASTSPLIALKDVDNGFAALTQNSVFFIDSLRYMSIPWQAVTNIRLGTHPDIALQLLKGEDLTKHSNSMSELNQLSVLFDVSNETIKKLLNAEFSCQRKKLICIMELAVGYFKSQRGARDWFASKNRGLGDVKPIALLNTEKGYERVKNSILKLMHGMTA
jgi:hypothetical protein